MNVISKKNGTVAIILIVLLTLSAWFFLHMRQKQAAMNVNCSSIIQYNHQAPDFTASLEFVFRLEENLDGYTVLSGNIHSARGTHVISRTVHFSYVMNRPGEIEISDMRYIKNPRDTADDESFRRSFFYVPEGAVRQLRINPSRNGWLIGNLQSPFALCVSR
ncbi:hypothetical protein ACX5CW_004108 [Enterobacter ludwigii]